MTQAPAVIFKIPTESPQFRRTIYPRLTPAGYPLAERLAARIEEARAERDAGTNSLGLVFPSPTGKLWGASNFNRNVLARAYRKAGWRDANGEGRWVLHSLRHVFCTTARSPGSSTPPTCPVWPGTPTTASRSTCTSAPPQASSIVPAPPPNSHQVELAVTLPKRNIRRGHACSAPAGVTAGRIHRTSRSPRALSPCPSRRPVVFLKPFAAVGGDIVQEVQDVVDAGCVHAHGVIDDLFGFRYRLGVLVLLIPGR